MEEQGEVTFTYSGVVVRDGRNAVGVRFERQRDGKTDFADGFVPECTFQSVEGFSPDELEVLKVYLKENQIDIIQNAKKLSQFKNLFS